MSVAWERDARAPILPGISQEELARVTAPVERAWTLPPAAYTDPAIFTLEKKHILAKGWHAVARVDQVANAGDYMALTLLDQPMMIVHGQDGVIRALSRVCLHRAAAVAEGEGNRKLFTCPYHGWSYATDGRLVRAPLMDGADGFAEKDCRLPEIRSEVRSGFIFVNLDNDAPPLGPEVAAFEERFAPFRLDEMVVAKTLEFDSPWNWKTLVENFMEAYHHSGTHAQSLEPTYHARDSFVEKSGDLFSILRMPASHDPDHVAELPAPDAIAEDERRDLFAAVIYPCFLIVLQAEAMAWYQVLPQAHDRLLLRIHICVPRAATVLPDYDEIAGRVAGFVNDVHHEDIGINDDVSRGLAAPLTRQGRLSPLEKPIWLLNQWWLQRMADAKAG